MVISCISKITSVAIYFSGGDGGARRRKHQASAIASGFIHAVWLKAIWAHPRRGLSRNIVFWRDVNVGGLNGVL